MTRETRVFDAMQPVLDALRRDGAALGHRHQQGDALRRAAGARARPARPRPRRWSAATPRRTPSRTRRRCSRPRAASACEPRDCVYVGDDLRDVQAGRAAGMATVAAAWGYLGEGEPIDDWGADHVIESPGELLKLLALA